MSFSTESDQRLTHREHFNPMAADIDLSPTAHTPICTDFGETPVENDRQCRICYGDDGDPTLGRLFSPCKCKGTMRYVHVECLRRWREMSVNKESTYRCDQCHYVYRIARTDAAMFMNNQHLREAITVGVLVVLFWIGGFIHTTDSIIEFDDTSFGHWLRGGVVMGLFGFFGMIIKAFWSFGQFLDLWRPFRLGGLRGGESGGKKDDVLFKIVLLIVVLIGLWIMVQQVYKWVGWVVDRVMNKAEDEILEVS